MTPALRQALRALLPLTCALALLSSGTACAKKTTAPAAPVLVWQDEFDGPAGQSPDSSKWGFDIGTGWGNNQLEYDTPRPENASLDGQGHLVITARKESWNGQNYTSARMNTLGHFARTGGRFEARMRMPSGQGMWPAFWLLGSDFATTGWPGCGEIDVMEYRGQENTVLHGSLHGPGYSGGGALTSVINVPGAPMDSVFHVYSVDWSPTKLTWAVDGTTYFTVTPHDVPSGAQWVFTHPFFVILDLAVGGGFVGSPNASTTFPQQLIVDYVRVYSLGS